MSDKAVYERWHELSPLLEKAQGLSGDELDSFCTEQCGGDEQLMSLLKRLLRDSVDTDQKIHDSIAQVAKDASDPASLIGTDVGAYTLVEKIGEGGMGTVYLASRADGEFDKKVAVKVVRRQLPSSVSADMFRNERQALANLQHPSIPTLVDSGELEDGRPYFICDFIDGESIDDYCRDNSLSVNKILDLFERVAQAVQHAHNNFILHLDIKPKNVLVQGNGTPSLLDFGVARVIGDDSDNSRAYSPNYASPEQIRGERLTAASDVYSLGALLYFLLAKKPPFSVLREAPSETVFAKRAEFVEHLQENRLLDAVDTDLRAIVRKAMSDQPAQRYPTVESLLNDLLRYRELMPVKAREGGVGYRMAKLIRRQRLAIGLVGAAFVAVAGFALREAELRRQAQASAEAAEREAETARQISTFSVDVFELLDPIKSRGNSVTARELLDRASQRVDESLVDQPKVGATLKHTMGKAYVGLGLNDPALEQLELALELSESAGNASSLDHAQILYSLGKQYDAIARHKDAIDSLTAGLEIQKEILGPQHVQNIDNLVSLARLNRILTNYEKAEAQLEEASKIISESGNVSGDVQRRLLISQSRVFGETGRKKLALKSAQQAVQVGRTHETDPLSFAMTLVRLGGDYINIAEHESALTALHEAWSVVEGEVVPNHPRLADINYLASIAYLNLDNYATAEDTISKGIALQEAALGDSHPAVAMSLSVLGEVHHEQGQYQQAETHLRRALNIMRSVHPEEHVNVSLEKFKLARVYHKSNNLNEAERLIDDAITHYARVDPAANRVVLDARLLKADILIERGKSDEAKAIYAEVFAVLEGLNNLLDSEIDTFAQRYADFLSRHGEAVSLDQLKARLRAS